VPPAVGPGQAQFIITVYMAAMGIRTAMAIIITIIRIGPTGRIGLTGPAGRNNQLLSPNRVDQAFNLWPDPDHRQAWVVLPECREAVVAKFGVDINLCVKSVPPRRSI